jgi:hypothetical protein
VERDNLKLYNCYGKEAGFEKIIFATDIEAAKMIYFKWIMNISSVFTKEIVEV